MCIHIVAIHILTTECIILYASVCIHHHTTFIHRSILYGIFLNLLIKYIFFFEPSLKEVGISLKWSVERALYNIILLSSAFIFNRVEKHPFNFASMNYITSYIYEPTHNSQFVIKFLRFCSSHQASEM